jgi:hypothetical protein
MMQPADSDKQRHLHHRDGDKDRRDAILKAVDRGACHGWKIMDENDSDLFWIIVVMAEGIVSLRTRRPSLPRSAPLTLT